MIRPIDVIWSCCHIGPHPEDYICRVIDRAADCGVRGVELGGHVDIGAYLTYPAFPALSSFVDRQAVEQHRDSMKRVVEHAHRRGVRLGMWHHELGGPEGLLDAMPELRAADGWMNLESPLLYDYVRARVSELFDHFPSLDEIVLTVTETRYAIARRPFSDMPISERLYRLVAAMLEVVESRHKKLVVRPFSAIRADEFAMREALARLGSDKLAVMYKTEPYDWHAYSADEPLIGTLPQYEVRAETDGGAEYYGQGVFPCCYADHIAKRITAAQARGASVVALRVDRGAHHPSLGSPINEANVVAVTRWCQDPATSMDRHIGNWMKNRHGVDSPQLIELLQHTFDVIRDALYIDCHSFSHTLIPSLDRAKHTQLGHLFEPKVTLEHMAGIWSVLAERQTLSFDEILQQKQRAVKTAKLLRARYREIAGELPSPTRESLCEQFDRLVALAGAFESATRVVLAYLAQSWGLPSCVEAFALEAERAMQLADRIDKEHGRPLFPALEVPPRLEQMSDTMRRFVRDLTYDHQQERLLRDALAKDDSCYDYVLCGLLSEGHQLQRRLHTGSTGWLDDRPFRSTGHDEPEGFSYTMKLPEDAPYTLTVLLHDDGVGRQGWVVAGGQSHAIDAPPFQGWRTFQFAMSPATADRRVRIWSSSAAPLRVGTLSIHKKGDRKLKTRP